MPENPSLSPAAVAGTTRKIVATLPRSRYIAAASVRLSASVSVRLLPAPWPNNASRKDCSWRIPHPVIWRQYPL
uniref:hypothetical protein n=1 Tax=Escherichia coli TaxID=562 RepID=UPI0002EEF87F|nr:hypothetical protein [Escherichia coli]